MTSPLNNVSPKPIPHIFNNFNHLTTKKEKYSITPKVRKIPPRPPCKSISKITRLSYSLNNSQNEKKPQLISFKQDSQPELSKLYNETHSGSYFKQCFIIEEKIGSGSFGDAYKVKSRDDDKYYAVKVSREKFKGKVDREEKLNEVCKHEQLPNHDHLVKFYRAWEEKQRLYIQTELCSMSLSALGEKNHEISEDIVWRYLIDLLKAIDHLHSNNLIHLDIKPENIFISQNDLCKLGDFGLVLDVNNGQSNEATEGDPKYLASEIMQGIYTKSADIFSLGMTILELASDLDLPSRGQGWHMLRSGQIPEHIFAKMSIDLKNVIILMINPDYKLRPSAKELLNHPIVIKFEKKRRRELQLKSLGVFYHRMKSILFNFWSKILSYLNVASMPFRNRFPGVFPAIKKDNSNPNSSPINHNRTYISNYLDQYSDDDTNDVRLMSSSSFDSSISNEDEMFKDNLSSRNLCSTVYRNTQNANSVISSLSPFFPTNNTMESIKSVTQRLTFDEFSSDEMEMTENEDERLAPLQSNSISSANSDVVGRLRFRPNISRKNLAKTFDELQSTSSNT